MKTLPASAHNGATILLVDDNPHGLVARRTVLQELGYVIHTGACGAEALDLLGRHKVDLVITDFRMPNMDGVELITRIRQLRGNLPIILLSGFVEPLGLTEQSTGVIYWEGSQRVSATRAGQPLGGEAYVELTGYAAAVR